MSGRRGRDLSGEAVAARLPGRPGLVETVAGVDKVHNQINVTTAS